ncbi:hypothetical protein [Trichormus azollae]|uniref:hypothetical protein n=1 Tax=Trichormus azollae TaxID=1164 RepID=UPI00325EBE40
MNAISTSQDKAHRCALAVEHEIFPEEVLQLLYGKSKNVYRVLFTIRDTINTVVCVAHSLYVCHTAQEPITVDDLEDFT